MDALFTTTDNGTHTHIDTGTSTLAHLYIVRREHQKGVHKKIEIHSLTPMTMADKITKSKKSYDFQW